jgi:hypothetical protein
MHIVGPGIWQKQTNKPKNMEYETHKHMVGHGIWRETLKNVEN